MAPTTRSHRPARPAPCCRVENARLMAGAVSLCCLQKLWVDLALACAVQLTRLAPHVEVAPLPAVPDWALLHS